VDIFLTSSVRVSSPLVLLAPLKYIFLRNSSVGGRMAFVTENSEDNGIRDEIQAAANQIAKTLQEKGEITLGQLTAEAKPIESRII
jgi:hypothetical protein